MELSVATNRITARPFAVRDRLDLATDNWIYTPISCAKANIKKKMEEKLLEYSAPVSILVIEVPQAT